MHNAVLVVYGDYECPYTLMAHPIIKELRKEVEVEFRNFPLAHTHPHAQRAAEAGEAARSQGRFWEYHDVLFENQEHLTDHDLVRYAVLLGMDVEKFVNDLATHAFAAKVRDDFQSGLHAGVNGTPTFFVNGIRFDGPVTFYALHDAISGVGSVKGRSGAKT